MTVAFQCTECDSEKNTHRPICSGHNTYLVSSCIKGRWKKLIIIKKNLSNLKSWQTKCLPHNKLSITAILLLPRDYNSYFLQGNRNKKLTTNYISARSHYHNKNSSIWKFWYRILERFYFSFDFLPYLCRIHFNTNFCLYVIFIKNNQNHLY